jgi:hypothetical protein
MTRKSLHSQEPSQAQVKRFVAAARTLNCDESEERFDAALKKIGAHKPLVEKTGSTKTKKASK